MSWAGSTILESLAGAWRYERVVTSIAHGEALATSTGILQVDPTLDHHVHYRETGLLRFGQWVQHRVSG
jgi:hypothetical protein